MNILNQKEEVLKVQLTKHGRKVLSMGIFQPKYFSFFDDSVIYDLSYCNLQEDTNDIQNRILDKSLTFGAINLLTTSTENELGSSGVTNDYAPCWDLNVLNGKILSLSNNSTYYKKIFNIENVQYDISLDEKLDVSVEEDYLLIDLKELNLEDETHNFEIEVITFDKISGGVSSKLEKKLKFHQNKTNILDGIIYEDSDLPYNFFNVDIDKDDVAYYLDILVDDEIDTDFIITREKKTQERTKYLYTSTNIPDVCEPCCNTEQTSEESC